LLVLQLEAEALCVKRDRACDVFHLITDAVNALNEAARLC